MYIVTGAAGFIGSNIIKTLNTQGIHNILAVDDLSNGHQFINLRDLIIADYLDAKHFKKQIKDGHFDKQSITAILHQGACSDTTEWDGRYMLENNFEYSKALLHFALRQKIPFIYASSAAVYGASTTFKAEAQYEKPLNVYGYSKLLFDQYVRQQLARAKSQIAGLRYFNVYGPREQHKGKMASVAFHHNQQIQESNCVKLFEGSHGYEAGEQQRDFIYVDDVVAVNLWFLSNPHVSGIFNCGTGKSQAFNDIANSVIRWHDRGEIQYIPFPEHLKAHYQSYTQADISALRAAGYNANFHTVETGVADYLDKLNEGKA